MTGPFDSAWFKWARAVVHVHALESEFQRFAAANTTDITVGFAEYDARRHGFPFGVVDLPQWPSTWGVLLGDVVTNWRSVLDHCAWAIVHRGRGKGGFPLEERDAVGVQFPIASTREGFNKQAARRLVGARRSDIAVVRRTQPYHLRSRYQRNALYILQRLSNSDKHRSIQPVPIVPVEGKYHIGGMVDCEASKDQRMPRRRHLDLKVGQELGVIRVRKTGPNPDIHDVDFAMNVQPGISRTQPLDEFVRVTQLLIARILNLFGAPPNELRELGEPSWFFQGAWPTGPAAS